MRFDGHPWPVKCLCRPLSPENGRQIPLPVTGDRQAEALANPGESAGRTRFDGWSCPGLVDT